MRLAEALATLEAFGAELHRVESGRIKVSFRLPVGDEQAVREALEAIKKNKDKALDYLRRVERGEAVVAGCSLRKCRKCHRWAWHWFDEPRMCCGKPMEEVPFPKMTLAEYAAFIGCEGWERERSEDLRRMMDRDRIRNRTGG